MTAISRKCLLVWHKVQYDSLDNSAIVFVLEKKNTKQDILMDTMENICDFIQDNYNSKNET